MPSITTMVLAYRALETHATMVDRVPAIAERASALRSLLIDLRARDRLAERDATEKAPTAK